MRAGKRDQRGFILIAAAVSILVIIAMLGVAIDIGRAYITKNEAQCFTDAAALAAARELNGTSAGVTAARNAVANSTNKWNMATRPFTGATIEFSADRANWTANPTNPATVRYVRVLSPNSLTIYFLRVLGVPESATIAAQTVAGVAPPTSYSQGLFPFAPIAHSPTPPNYGYERGDELTLLWPSSVNHPKIQNLCESDQNQDSIDAINQGKNSDRGYIMENSASALSAAIEDDHMDYTVTLGSAVNRTSGVKNSVMNGALANRVAQDSSPYETDYDRYVANHDSSPMRRLVVVPILGDADHAIVVGFATVFLPPDQPSNPNYSRCAMYVGPAGDPTGGGGATGASVVRILE